MLFVLLTKKRFRVEDVDEKYDHVKNGHIKESPFPQE